MLNVHELYVGDIIIQGSVVGVVCRVSAAHYEIFYVCEGHEPFKASTPREMFGKGFFYHTRIIRS